MSTTSVSPQALAINGGTPVRSTFLPYGRQAIDEADIQAVVDVLRSDWLTTGPKVGEFEEAFAARVQNDADELEYQTEREVRKHPERKEEREKYVQTYQKEVTEFLAFLTQRTLPNTQLDPDHIELSGWVLFSTKNKWLGDWKKPEGFLLRFPIADKIVEFPFELPAQQGDLILRRRPQ